MLNAENSMREEDGGGEEGVAGGGGGEGEDGGRGGGGGGDSSSSSPPPAVVPPSLPHAVSTSLARLHFLNAYRLSVQPGAESLPNPLPQPEENGVKDDRATEEDADEYHVRWQGHGTQMALQIAKMEHDTGSSDVTLQAKGSPAIPGHRIVLAAASPFFRSVLQNLSAGQHPVIVVGGAAPHLLKQLVSFCYTGSLTLPHHYIPGLLKLAEELEVTGLIASLRQAHHTLTAPDPTTSLHPRHAPHPLPHDTPYRPPSFRSPTHTHFPFTPPLPHTESPPATPKRSATPLDVKDMQSKRVKVETVGRMEGEGDESSSTSPHPPHIPPGSAPPFLAHFPPHATSSSSSPNPSPPNSAPPHSFRGPSPLTLTPRHTSPSLYPSVSGVKEEPPLRLVPAPYLLTGSPHQSPHSHTSASPLQPAHTTSDLPPTPSTPATPTTPGPRIGDGVRGSSSSSTAGTGSSGSRVLLWRFLLDLLHNPRYTPFYIRWLDRSEGVFRIMESDMVAQLWGMARKNNNMNYEKMSRGMRTYYKRGILFHIDGTKLIYKFNTKEPEIQQRMRFYDLSERHGDDVADQPTTSYLPTPSGLPPVTSSEGASFSPFLPDNSNLPHSLFYYPYLSLLGAKRELY